MIARQVRAITIAALAIASTVALTPGEVAAQATPEAATDGARVFELPGDQIYPEGVAYDPAANVFYVGSTTDGTIYRGDLASGEVEVFSEAGADDRTSALGMEVDDDGRLFVAGGPTGLVSIYDTATGDLTAQFTNELAPNTFLNDVAIAADGAAYVTDSFNPVLFRIAPDAGAGEASPPAGDGVTPNAAGLLETFIEFTGTVFAFEEGFNANGIVATEDGAYLLIVTTNTGQLFRVAVESGEVGEVALGGADLTNGDGLALDGQTLYVLRNQDALIVPVVLGSDLASGQAGESFTDPSFAFPTTIALTGDGGLLVVNSQFDRQPSEDPVLPFTVVLVAPPGASDATPIATPDA